MSQKEFLNVQYGKVCLHIWKPEGEIKLLYQICHGMAEYLERYAEFAETLSKKGILVFGIDHPGHGESDGTRGYFAPKKGWKYLVECNVQAAQIMKGRYPGVKLVTMGHSMGSFVARTIAGYYSEVADKYIFMGTAGPNPAVGAGKALANMIVPFARSKPNKFLNGLSTGPYGKAEESYTTEFDWLNTIPEEVQKYIDDEGCGFLFTTAGYRDLFTGLGMIDPKKWTPKLDKSKKYLLVSGTNDPVGSMSEGVKKVYESMKNAGCDVTMKLYEGYRHEILNDKCKEEVISDILNWLEI